MFIDMILFLTDNYFNILKIKILSNDKIIEYKNLFLKILINFFFII